MTENVNSKKSKRRRRSKAEVAAEKAAKELQQAEDVKMEEAGFEKVRNRDDKGHYIADDPSTPENEAWDWEKVEESPIVDPEPMPTPIPEPEPEVVVEPEAKVVVETPEPVKVQKTVSHNPVTYANPDGEHIANSFKRRRALRRGQR